MYYPVDLSNRFYKYILNKNILYGPYSKKDFLHDIYKSLITNIKGKYKKEPYKDWNYSGSDMELYQYFKGSDIISEYYLRNIIYYDGYFRIIDPRVYIKEAIKYWDNYYNSKKYEYDCDTSFYSQVFGKDFRNYKFRYDPVPYIHERIPHRTFKRARGVKRLYQIKSDPEYGKYIRPGALPFGSNGYWDFTYRDHKKHESWKNQKKRKQWM